MAQIPRQRIRLPDLSAHRRFHQHAHDQGARARRRDHARQRVWLVL